MDKKEIAVTIILTTTCNLKCKYCINESGNDLKKGCVTEWNDVDSLVSSLEKIAELRKISTIKLFGGEPTLRKDLIIKLIENKHKFVEDNETFRFAMTTNAYVEFEDEFIKKMTDEKVIFNISVDGPKEIHDDYRISQKNAGTFDRVMNNVNKLKEQNIPFALMSVLDERVLKHGYSLQELCQYLANMTHYYKVEPSYCIKSHGNMIEEEVIRELIRQETELIERVFAAIKNLKTDDFIFENNILRTISNCVYNNRKQYVCSAGNHIAIYPNGEAYSCYNLMDEEYNLTKKLIEMDQTELENKLNENAEKLKIENFGEMYREVELFGDYCPRENDPSTFAYRYRLTMVKTVQKELSTILPGTKEHLSLLGYISMGYNGEYYKNVPKKIMMENHFL